MQLFSRSWFGLWIVAILLLSGCASASVPAISTPTVVPREAVVVLPELLAEPQRWSGQLLVLIAPVWPGETERMLAAQRTSDPTAPPASSGAFWLAQPLPETVTRQLGAGGVVRLRGRLSPPGAYGPDQQFTYQFSAERAELLQPERTTLANLAANPGALDRILLRLEGTLLLEQESALLVEEVSAGGVPTASGREIKVPRDAVDAQVIGQLNQSGQVRWGAVQMIGWWQDGAFVPFSIVPAERASPSPG